MAPPCGGCAGAGGWGLLAQLPAPQLPWGRGELRGRHKPTRTRRPTPKGQFEPGVTNPDSYARMTAWTRSRKPNLPRTLLT
ncbi:hypothetical protein GCM10018775_09160 [Streptomyces umbrinus]|nr:hypothetical protein GCM10018775_09160 [Streptomyces umbrinus]